MLFSEHVSEERRAALHALRRLRAVIMANADLRTVYRAAFDAENRVRDLGPAHYEQAMRLSAYAPPTAAEVEAMMVSLILTAEDGYCPACDNIDGCSACDRLRGSFEEVAA